MKEMILPHMRIEGRTTVCYFESLYDKNSYLYESDERDYYDIPEGKKLFHFTIPDFQRPECWDVQRQKSFIESLFIGYEPGAFVVTRKIPKEDVAKRPQLKGLGNLLLDGQQRLSAMRDFFKGNFNIFNDISAKDIFEDKVDFKPGVCGSKPIGLARRICFKIIEMPPMDKKSCIELYLRLNFGGINHEEAEKHELEKRIQELSEQNEPQIQGM